MSSIATKILDVNIVRECATLQNWVKGICLGNPEVDPLLRVDEGNFYSFSRI